MSSECVCTTGLVPHLAYEHDEPHLELSLPLDESLPGVDSQSDRQLLVAGGSRAEHLPAVRRRARHEHRGLLSARTTSGVVAEVACEVDLLLELLHHHRAVVAGVIPERRRHLVRVHAHRRRTRHLANHLHARGWVRRERVVHRHARLREEWTVGRRERAAARGGRSADRTDRTNRQRRQGGTGTARRVDGCGHAGRRVGACRWWCHGPGCGRSSDQF